MTPITPLQTPPTLPKSHTLTHKTAAAAMKRGQSRRTPSADLLVCFPPRTHLTTIPIPSPARASGDSIIPTTRRRRRSNSIGGGGSILHAHRASGGDGQKNNREDQFSEPSSPKVTCSGQVKGRRRSGSSCRGWNSVMQEIERVHVEKKEQKKKRAGSWGDSFGIKKDVLQFLSCLRSFKFDFRCFGSLHGAAISSDDEEEDEDGTNQETAAVGEDVLSRWLMVLNEDVEDNVDDRGLDMKVDCDDGMRDEDCAMQAPPANALLLMRCRSAPGRGWGDERREKLDLKKENGKKLEEEEKEMGKEKERKSLEILMRYDAGFGKLSSDIAKETWVLGGFQDPLSRSRSWKR